MSILFPPMNGLVFRTYIIRTNEFRGLPVNSKFHMETLTCRSLIRQTSDVIASPEDAKRSMFAARFRHAISDWQPPDEIETFKIYVFTSKKVDIHKLAPILAELRLEEHVDDRCPPNLDEIYKLSLIFTMQNKLAPLWNRVGDYLVQGERFYNFDEVNAVKVDVNFRDGQACLVLDVRRITIRRPFERLQNVYVLPRMTVAKVISMSERMPRPCNFIDYDQLRQHWENLYGYSIPEAEDQVSKFYNVKFFEKGQDFTYPNTCLASDKLLTTRIEDTETMAIINEFLSDVQLRSPSVCGEQLQIQFISARNP